MAGHSAEHHPRQDPRPPHKWAWDCPPCGARSRGYPYATEAAAIEGGKRHDKAATAADRRIHQAIYGPRGPRGRS